MSAPLRKIELRKISHHASLSEETNAYTAQVWVDGVHLCDVSNHGTGGPDMQHPAKGKTRADIDELDAYIKATRAPRDTGMVLKGEPFMMQDDLETVCGELLTDHLISKDLQRLLKRTVAVFDPAKKAIMSYKTPKTPAQRAHCLTHARQTVPNGKVLNDLPFDEALALFRAHA